MVTKLITEQVSERSTPVPVLSNTTPVTSNTASPSTTRYTPSPTPSAFLNRDPDEPVPSIERDVTPVLDDARSDTSLSIYTPSVSSHGDLLRQGSDCGSLDQRLQNLRLLSANLQQSVSIAENNAFQIERPSASPTPSIRVTPTPSATTSRHSTANREMDGLADGVSGLRMSLNYRRAHSEESNSHLRHDSLDGDRAIGRSTASPSRRRRSSSGINRATHKVEDEEPPQALFHERKIQEALSHAKKVTGRLARVLSEANLHPEQGSNVRSMYQQATKLSAFEPPSRRIVGLVGDSGVGKSSLINSLLDRIEFARASNSGAACTCVVTEYHFHDQNDYLIEVDYFTAKELRAQFEQLLSAYREHEATIPAERLEDLRQKADLAKSTFRASFRRKLNENSEVLSSLPFDDAINTMMVWVSELLPGLDGLNGNARESFENINQCSDRLKTLTSETEENEQTCLWPFIRTLKVYMKAHILSKGLILADLPGLRDLNSARQNVTERYVRQCDQIFAVTRIGRATTDAGVKEVFELARRASLSNVGVICTQSDDIRSSEAKDDWPHERARISRMEEDIVRRQLEIASLDEDIRDFSDLVLSTEDAQELLGIQQERESTMRSLETSEFELKHHIISIRNRKVCSELKKRYATYPNLQTFCVSNTIYFQHREKPVQKSLPFLNLSGILELRRYCVGIISESHMQATLGYIKDEIPALLGSIQLWIQAGSANVNAERKEQILNAISVVQIELDELTSPASQLNYIKHEVTSMFNDQFWQYMCQRAEPWSASAGRASKGWDWFHHSTYAAFCRQHGTYQTQAVGFHCWNEEAITLMTSDMSGLWNAFHSKTTSFLDRTQRDIDRKFTNILKVISDTASSGNDLRAQLTPLISTIRHRKSLLLQSVEMNIDIFQSNMSEARTDALSPIRSSIIGQLMEDEYNKANGEGGRGSDSRRKEIIKSGFGSLALFTNHRRRFKKLFFTISEKLQQEITDTVARQVKFVENDLDTLRDENVVLESERNPEFRKRLELAATQARAEMGEIRGSVNSLFNSNTLIRYGWA